MRTVMEVGDIWLKDTRDLALDNFVFHWLITDIELVDTDKWLVKYICLEKGRADYMHLYTIDMTGNPYWKKVA